MNELLKTYFLKTVMPLLGFPENLIRSKEDKIINVNENDYKKFQDCIFVENMNDVKYLYIGLVFLKKYLFYVEFNELEINDEQIVIATHLVYSFSAMIESNRNLFSEKTNKHIKKYLLNENITTRYITSIIDCAVQRGICDWLLSVKNESSLRIERLFDILENWSKKTYEGHRVCYGILINQSERNNNEKNNYYNDFLDFLEDEYSAVISDGISSIIEVDRECNFLNYYSIYKDDIIENCNLNDTILPYRFVQVISSYVHNDKIGVFLLQNGDIIISKSQSIYFIKRNGKWINFKYDTFKKIMNSKMEINKYNSEEFNSVLKSIFSTTLDVSLAHSGGIIAVVDYEINKEKLGEIISDIDNIYNKKSYEEIYNNECVTNEENIIKDTKKKMTKRKVIFDLLMKNNVNQGNILFDKIDRKLRSELVGLDGACILDFHGNVISFGAIIQNDPGSSGGGRGAAAKKLSKFGGFSIKISTDGYIEVYVNEEKIYSIK